MLLVLETATETAMVVPTEVPTAVLMVVPMETTVLLSPVPLVETVLLPLVVLAELVLPSPAVLVATVPLSLLALVVLTHPRLVPRSPLVHLETALPRPLVAPLLLEVTLLLLTPSSVALSLVRLLRSLLSKSVIEFVLTI